MIHQIDVFKSVEVKWDEETNSYRVSIHTPLYINKVKELSHTYSKEWSKQAIIQDVIKYYL